MADETELAPGDVDFRLIAESIPQIVWMADPDGAAEYFNERGSQYTGMPRGANTGWDWLQLIHPDLLKAYGVDYAQGFHLGRPAPIELYGGP